MFCQFVYGGVFFTLALLQQYTKNVVANSLRCYCYAISTFDFQTATYIYRYFDIKLLIS